MEVADQIVVINDGRIEQIGTPDELYDQPANDFVMRFVGPVTQLGDVLVRPHDLELYLTDPGDGRAATVARITRVGFEVRVELTVDGSAATTLATLTRTEALALRIDEDSTLWVRPTAGAPTVPVERLPHSGTPFHNGQNPATICV